MSASRSVAGAGGWDPSAESDKTVTLSICIDLNQFVCLKTPLTWHSTLQQLRQWAVLEEGRIRHRPDAARVGVAIDIEGRIDTHALPFSRHASVLTPVAAYTVTHILEVPWNKAAHMDLVVRVQVQKVTDSSQ
jgi:hypothetical protein